MDSTQDPADPTHAIETGRRVGLVGATLLGVGAIVGGGILALAGVAFERTGAGAVLAFALNGAIAVVTALSFAELATAFPRSGGTYAFSKRVLSVGRAFSVGWVVWFASIAAAALYALGFGAFAAGSVAGVLEVLGIAEPTWLRTPVTIEVAAVVTTALCAAVVARTTSGGGYLVSILKVVIFAVLIGGGVWALAREGEVPAERFRPFLPSGGLGLIQAMGFTFIALQGFDLIAAVAGEVRAPRKTLPRAMLLSLAIALLVYVPLLLVVTAVGVPEGSSIAALAAERGEMVLAAAAREYMGPVGLWLVLLAGVLSMLSGLLANLYAGSRIAGAMARDGALPGILERIHGGLGTPVPAIVATAVIALGILLLVGDVASAGAASSLVFLLSFALAHVLCVLTRRRKPRHGGFRTPLWPWLPIGGAVVCASLAVFQAVVVPAAGLVAGIWLAAGGAAYAWLFARRARVQDAVHEVVDEDLLALRGRSPLVLVPIYKPDRAGSMALVGACLSPPRVGRVMLLNVVPALQSKAPVEFERCLENSARVLRESMGLSAHAGARVEALATLGLDPWTEIERVARAHDCATLLLGMSELSDSKLRGRLEALVSGLSCNVVVLRAPPGWDPASLRRVLVPIRGEWANNAVRARLLTSLRHRAAPEMAVSYLLVQPEGTPSAACRRRERSYAELVRSEATAPSEVRTALSDDVAAAIVAAAEESDLLVLGLGRQGRARRVFSEPIRKVIAATSCPMLLISSPQ